MCHDGKNKLNRITNVQVCDATKAQWLYEQLINKLILSKLNELDRDKFYIKESEIDKHEAARVLSQYLSEVIRFAFNLITGDNSLEKQIELSNKVISLLK